MTRTELAKITSLTHLQRAANLALGLPDGQCVAMYADGNLSASTDYASTWPSPDGLTTDSQPIAIMRGLDRDAYEDDDGECVALPHDALLDLVEWVVNVRPERLTMAQVLAIADDG